MQKGDVGGVKTSQENWEGGYKPLQSVKFHEDQKMKVKRKKASPWQILKLLHKKIITIKYLL